MSKHHYYYYDHDSCSFREIEKAKRKWVGYVASVMLAAFVLSGIGVFALSSTVETAEEIAQREEIRALQSQLHSANTNMVQVASQLETLQETDRELYRALLNAEPIPEEQFRMGVGGSEDQRVVRFTGDTGRLLRESSQTLDRIERQIGVQRSSFDQLSRLADQREARMRHQPAILPIDGRFTSGFGMRRHPIFGSARMHSGVDFACVVGTPVRATADGIVSFAGVNSGYGNLIQLNHPLADRATYYAHLSRFASGIRNGARVERGQVIGHCGNTGLSTAPHLHYEVRRLSDDEPLNPVTTFAPGVSAREYQRLLAMAQQENTSLD
ncbi:M23 family metallopeptidase [soil metagenome]